MSHVVAALRARAIALRHRIVLPETTDPRILQAAAEVHKENIADIILIGKRDDLYKRAKECSADLSTLAYIDPYDKKHEGLVQTFATNLLNRRKGKDMNTFEEAMQRIQSQPLFFGNSIVASNYAHGQVAGSLSATSDVVKAALQCIGTAPGIKTASSFMLMLRGEQEYVFSDCGFVIDPNAEQLADIALSSAHNAQQLLLIEPKVAMLSFSTMGSAHHPLADKVKKAMTLVKERDSSFLIDGEMQFDAAFVPSVGARKAPGSPVAGQANVFIFPDLNAGNIGYKIAARLGEFEAIGPILQGFAKPTNDLSRGCAVEDIVDTIVITALQTGMDYQIQDIPNIDRF